MSTLLSTCGLAATSGQEAKPQPNILFIFAEDMGLDINPYLKVPFDTPGFDRLAAEGATFNNAWATQASCSPSRASVFTGLYPHQHGQISLQNRGSRVHPGIATYMDALRAANYYTGVTYKIHFEPTPEFDFGPQNTAWGRPYRLAAAAEQVMDTAAEQGQPWFLMLNTFDSHAVNRNLAGRLENLFRHQFGDSPEVPLTADEVNIPPYLTGTQDVEANANFMDNIAGYYNAIRRIDDTIQRVYKALEERDLLDNTIIIFSADHGPVLPRGKQMTYNVSLHVPFFIVAPDAEPGSRRNEFISLVDMMPTIVELAGGEPPELSSDARSVLKTLRGEVEPRELLGGAFFLHWGPTGLFPSYTVRDERYKLIYNPRYDLNRPWREYNNVPFMLALPDVTDEVFKEVFTRAMRPPQYELYDLQEDFWEFNNLAEDPAHRRTLERMKANLERWRTENEDPFMESSRVDALVQLNQEASRLARNLDSDRQQDLMRMVADHAGQLMREGGPLPSLREEFATGNQQTSAQAAPVQTSGETPPDFSRHLNASAVGALSIFRHGTGGYLTSSYRNLEPVLGERFWVAHDTGEMRGLLLTTDELTYQPGMRLRVRLQVGTGHEAGFNRLDAGFVSGMDPSGGFNPGQRISGGEGSNSTPEAGEWIEWTYDLEVGSNSRTEGGSAIIGQPVQFLIRSVPGASGSVAIDSIELSTQNPI